MSYKEVLIPYHFEVILIGFFLFISLEIGVAASAVPFPESWQTFMRNIKSIGTHISFKMEEYLSAFCQPSQFLDASTMQTSWNTSSMLCTVLQLLDLTITTLAHSHSHSQCKSTQGSHNWPTSHEWSRLNNSISGRLLQPPPPGAVCHPSQPTYDPSLCPSVVAGWNTSKWHSDDPISSMGNNFNNDSCLPDPNVPCSGEGYPDYVVNATCADDVKKGVDFARRHNIRLIVKGTGHDYLGR
jgi:hypothetical protein